jgi:purine-binding chemotaxis protein CheW
VFRIGVEQWAVPVSAVERVVPVPATELALGPKERTWAIGQWQGRKLPLVDISEGRQASDRQSAPWMVMLGQGPLLLGLTVSECQQFLDLPQAAVASIPGDPLLAGVALLPDGARLQVLDVAKLFGLTPEASISRRAPTPLHAPCGAVQPDATEPLPYLVFDADQRYASPVDGIVGVVELPAQAREDLCSGRPAFLAWRGQTVRLVSLPAIARSEGLADPQLAVLVQAPGGTTAPLGIAIHSLTDWLPAHSARRSGMRMGAMGEFGLINAKGAVDHANLVVVDLAQMAYLLG